MNNTRTDRAAVNYLDSVGGQLLWCQIAGYLNQSYNRILADIKDEGISPPGPKELSDAVLYGAGMRVRSVMMTINNLCAGGAVNFEQPVFSYRSPRI